VTNAFTLPAEVQEAEFGARPSSEVNAGRVVGAKLVKAFNQLAVKRTVFQGIASRDAELTAKYVHPMKYKQHNPQAADGVEA
jgi:hypothetical protein